MRLNGTFVRLRSPAKQCFHHLHFLSARKSCVNSNRIFDFRKCTVERVGSIWDIEVRVPLKGKQKGQMMFDTVSRAPLFSVRVGIPSAFFVQTFFFEERLPFFTPCVK